MIKPTLRQSLSLLYIFGLAGALWACTPATSSAAQPSSPAGPTKAGAPSVPTDSKNPKPEVYEISGRVQDWTFGKLALRAEMYDNREGKVVVDRTTIAEDGSFTVRLPTAGERFARALARDTTRTCRESYRYRNIPVIDVSGPGHTVMPDPLVQSTLYLYAFQNTYDTEPFALIVNSEDREDGYTDVTYRFSETAGTYSARCAGVYAKSERFDEGETFDITILQAYESGWNTDLYTVKNTATGTVKVETSGPVPQDATWIYVLAE